MKRSDNVSLCTTQNQKKLRKRRELNAMAAPHAVKIGRSRCKRPSNVNTTNLVFQESMTSSDDEEEEDDDESSNNMRDGRESGGYMNLMRSGTKSNSSCCARRNRRKLMGLCHRLCLIFVIFSGLIVLLMLAWLHFSLRAQTEDLSAQLHQGYFSSFVWEEQGQAI